MVAHKLPPGAVNPQLYRLLQDLPPHQVGEIIGGRLVTSPRPASPHAFAATGIGGDLVNPFQRGRGGPGGWWILSEPELHLGEDVLVPELAGWRRERMPLLPNVAAFTLAPDWILEVLSPGTAGDDRIHKLPRYAGAGVAYVWLVDPRSQTLEVYRREGKFWTLIQGFQGESLVRAEPFEAIELHLGDLWIPGGEV